MNWNKLVPLDDRVLLQFEAEEKQTKSGLVLPDSSREEQYIALVLAIGLGKLLDSGERGRMSVKVGDRVLMRVKGHIIDEERQISIVSESNILGIIFK